MKNDPEEHAKQLSFDFDSPLIQTGIDIPVRRTAGLTLAYSAPSSASICKETTERDLIISEALSFARKLSW
ncbi:MAG: hypothetical protein WAN92_01385 [Herbaspirillum sp.]